MNAPRVTWHGQDRIYFAKYSVKENGLSKRKSKYVPAGVTNAVIDTRIARDCAQAWIDEWWTRTMANGGTPVPSDTVVPPTPVQVVHTFRSKCADWLAYREERCGPATLRGYKTTAYNHVLADLIADLPISEITPRHCYEYLQRLKVKKTKRAPDGFAPYYLRNIVNDVATFFDDCIKEGWGSIQSNPMESSLVKDDMPDAAPLIGKRDVIHLSAKRARTLIQCAAIPAHRRVRNVFSFTTGARPGEIQGTAWSFLHLEPSKPCPYAGWEGHPDECAADQDVPHFHIERQLTDDLRFDNPKKESNRCIPLHPVTVAALLWWRDTGWERHTGAKPLPDDAVFPIDGGLYGRPRGGEDVRDDLKKAGLPEQYKGHNITDKTFRASFLTALNDLEASDAERKALAGHSGGSVTDKHYTARHLDRYIRVIGGLDVGPVLRFEPHPTQAPNPHPTQDVPRIPTQRAVSRPKRADVQNLTKVKTAPRKAVFPEVSTPPLPSVTLTGHHPTPSQPRPNPLDLLEGRSHRNPAQRAEVIRATRGATTDELRIIREWLLSGARPLRREG